MRFVIGAESSMVACSFSFTGGNIRRLTAGEPPAPHDERLQERASGRMRQDHCEKPEWSNETEHQEPRRSGPVGTRNDMHGRRGLRYKERNADVFVAQSLNA